MHATRFQLGLISALSIALGISLTSHPAIGYPSAVDVSLGSNPIVNAGGCRAEHGWSSVMSASADHDLVITDIVFTSSHSGAGQPFLRLSSGADVGRFYIFGGSYHGGNTTHIPLKTGIRIPAGQNLEMNTNTTNDVCYAFSGYLAQP